MNVVLTIAVTAILMNSLFHNAADGLQRYTQKKQDRYEYISG